MAAGTWGRRDIVTKAHGVDGGRIPARHCPPAFGTSIDFSADSHLGPQAILAISVSEHVGGHGGVMSSSVSVSFVLIDWWVVTKLISC